MNELVSIKKMHGTENTVVSSLAVAEHFNKRHDRLLQSIEELYGDAHDFVGMFRKST